MKKIALLSLVLVAGSVFAAEPASFDPTYTQGSFSRAEVQTQTINAVKNDTLVQTGEVGEFAVANKAGAARDAAAVRAEGRQAAAAHTTVGEV